jgi:hypothetical protein
MCRVAKFKPSKSSPTYLTIGQKTLSFRSGLCTKSCERALDGLCWKGLIDLVKPEDSKTWTGRTYRLLPYKEVKERWKEWGYTHVLRKPGGGIDFCDSEGVVFPVRPAPASTNQQLGTGTSTTKLEIVHRANVSPGAGDTLSIKAGSKLAPQLDIGPEEITSDNTTSSGHDRESIWQTLTAYCGYVDDAAVRQIIASSQHARPNLSQEELLDALHAVGKQLLGEGRRVRNPIGWMISVVPDYVADKEYERRRDFEADRRVKAQVEKEQLSIDAAIHAHLSTLPRENEWTRILTFLEGKVNVHTLELLLKPVKFFDLQDGVLLLWKRLAEVPFVQFEIPIAEAIEALGLDVSALRYCSTTEIHRLLPNETEQQ